MGVTITALSLHSATEKIPTLKIQQSLPCPSERDAEGVVPYNSETTANSEQRATSGRPYILFGQLPSAAKSLRSVLSFTLYLCTTLVSYAHSSFLTPHSSFLTPHLPPHLCILPSIPTKSIELISNFTKMRKITKNLLTFLYGCGIV